MYRDDDTHVTPIVVDIETTAHPDARLYIDPPNLDTVSAPSNYKDEAKIAAYIADAKAQALAAYEANIASGAALDYNVGRIAVLGWWTAERGYSIRVCEDELQERVVLTDFWREHRGRTMVGFCVKSFDARYLVRRSQLLQVDYPWLDFGKYSEKGVIDLYLKLTFGDGHHDKGCMKRSLTAFCRRFGIEVADPISGKDVPALIAAGDYASVAAHCRADVELTVALAQRLGVVRVQEPALF